MAISDAEEPGTGDVMTLTSHISAKTFLSSSLLAVIVSPRATHSETICTDSGDTVANLSAIALKLDCLTFKLVCKRIACH